MSYTVEQLVAVNPYNPDILPDLENYVNEQVSSQTYSVNANLCLLRLYQFEPEMMSTQIVARIMIKALMAMSAPDLSLYPFLIPKRVQMEEQFKTLIVLSHYLETARFLQFWDEVAKSRYILEVVPGSHMESCNARAKPPSLTQSAASKGQHISVLKIVKDAKDVSRAIVGWALDLKVRLARLLQINLYVKNFNVWNEASRDQETLFDMLKLVAKSIK